MDAASQRMKTAATWLFVLPLFTEGVLPDVVKFEVAGLAGLAFARIVVSRQVLPQRAVERIYATFAVLSLTVIGYLAFSHWPTNAGTTRSYDTHAVLFVITYTAVAVFAALFFDEAIFGHVIWRASVLALWAAVISCAVGLLTGRVLLVNPLNGTLRMVGTMSEPSEWAPVLVLVLLLAVRRRSWPYVALALAGLLLADSPVCLLVMAVTVPLYYALVGSWQHRALLLAGAAVIPATVIFVQHADATAWLDSGNTTEVAAGRLLSGIQNVGTDGQEGSNARFADTTGVLAAARDNGWMHGGAGPGADATYFPAMEAAHGPVAGVNALWVSVLADFGEGGAAILAVLMITAAWRMQRSPAMAAVLLPLFFASLVNSAIPDWSFVALGIMLYGFGWAPGSRPAWSHWLLQELKGQGSELCLPDYIPCVSVVRAGAGPTPDRMRYVDGGGLSAPGRARQEKIRLAAAAMFEQDIKPVQIAHELRVSTKSVYQWRRRWRDGGTAALASKGPPSPPGGP